MFCLEVCINGKRVCTAGVEEAGRLMAALNWDYHSDDTDERQEKELGEKTNNPGLRVYGSSGGESHLHYSWLERGIAPGDLVTFKMIESEGFDAPETNDFGSYELTDELTPEEIGELEAKWESDSNLQDNPRYCLKVWFNQQHLCTAGLEDFGKLGVNFNWHNVAKHPGNFNSTPTVGVSGHLESQPFQFLRWSAQPLEIGDEISFKLIEACDFDPPEVIELVTPDTEDQWIIKHLTAIVEAKEKYRENLN